MSNERRFILFVALMFGWMLTFPYLLRSLGLEPPKKAAPPAAAGKDIKPAADRAALAKNEAKPGPPEVKPSGAREESKPAPGEKQAAGSRVPLIDSKELVLGSLDKSPNGYFLEVQLDQKGAGIDSVLSSRYEAEFEGRKNPHLPLRLVRRDPAWPPSLSFNLVKPNGALGQAADAIKDTEAAGKAGIQATPEDWLDSIVWEVVRDEKGQTVRQLIKEDPETKAPLQGQEIVFKATEDGLVVTKTFRLWQKAHGLEMDVRFESPDRERTIAYNLMGPHGLPIEGEWYTGTFRDAFFGTDNQGAIDLATYSAYDIAKKRDKPIDSTALPLRFAGIENQYFATFVEPFPPPAGQDDRIDREAAAVVLHMDESALQKADIGVRISTRPFQSGPNLPLTHKFRIFAGAKLPDALEPYGASGLATYRKNQWIPFAPYLARVFITPTLGFMYRVTEWVARLFNGTRGNYGIAIILLTLLVKMLMFPLGRKQALMAQRTQQLQPYLKEVQEKYKDDKERITKETLALYKKHGVNPVSGCLPALIQLPIFVGLWQALNTSAVLRHAPFLWINDLSAPDMLFKFPFDIMFLGHWFNLLPIVVVGLMLFQTKLFSPPATTPEAEMQQKTMKYMMVFMAVMFYKVPSGLGIYFITSSLWSIGERLLLPRITHAAAIPVPIKDGDSEDGSSRGKGGLRGKGGPGGNGPAAPAKPPGAIAQFWEKILDEARKDPTYRKVVGGEKDGERKPGEDDRRDRDRDRGKPRARPGRR